MYDRILLPTDGSAGMDAVIDHALGLARAHEATVDVVYVVDTATMSRLPMETSWDAVSSLLYEEGEDAMEAVERRAGDDLTVRSQLLEGAPHTEIVSYAAEEDCDLIVMGTHGRGGIDRLLLGSVAERVIRTSSVPVTIIRVDE